jgi:molybdopterin biosynthesis enzyme
MIVTEHHVSAALSYLADSPHPLAVARKAVTDAENESKRSFARAFLSAEGSVDARKAAAEIDDDHIAAKDAEADAIFTLEDHKAQTKSAETVIEIWRTESANTRACESVR